MELRYVYFLNLGIAALLALVLYHLGGGFSFIKIDVRNFCIITVEDLGYFLKGGARVSMYAKMTKISSRAIRTCTFEWVNDSFEWVGRPLN